MLEAEVAALRAGRQDEADALRQARLAALGADSDGADDVMDDPPDGEPAGVTAGAEELPADAEVDGGIRAADTEAAGAGAGGRWGAPVLGRRPPGEPVDETRAERGR